MPTTGPAPLSRPSYGEEAYCFIKRSYHLEDVRVRSYTAVRNTYAPVHAVFYFVSVVVGAKANST